ncbi:hypothetical protein MFLO_00220 [Listeria floridensis FSL S10-1187]|uniref:Uncharacterized protein n=1 Tax=Listeria floridensis FSL S10-1187 TaxID=1265817 RepID=A0ABP3B2W0_9LIST|nr:hypothetical protein [Listeria floridensis]EUJ33632.1 hypothetical protein MFLO_00220 [Listeria floridensis FSL S10-1187]
MYVKSLLAGIGLAILVFLASFILPNYTLATMYSFVAMLLVFTSIACSAFVSFGGRGNRESRSKQLRWSIMLFLAAAPNFVGFIFSYYL